MTRVQALENLLKIAKEVRDSIYKNGRVEAGSIRFMDLSTAIWMVEHPESHQSADGVQPQ